MFEMSVNVPEVRRLINEIAVSPGSIFGLLRLNVRDVVGRYLSELMSSELTVRLGRGRYERKSGLKTNYRNGYYHRSFTIKGIGEVRVRVPRDRLGEYRSNVLPQGRQYDTAVRDDLALMYLSGVSTRSLALLSKRLLGRSISHTEVSKANRELIDGVERWRTRSLSTEPIKYIFVDGANFRMRVAKTITLVPVLIAIGVTEAGHKKVLGLQSGDKESAGSWRQFIKDLKARGLDGSRVTLGLMDGLPGLEKVFGEEFPNAKVQRCQVHVARNVLAKVPRKLKKTVADDLRSIFYASSEKKARAFFDQFRLRWEAEIPSAVRCLKRSLDPCLTFFAFPDDEWISLRTTNIIERLIKEFKRRTKPMEIVAGEHSCYLLLAFVSLRMELHWRANPVGKVRANLPFFKEIAEKEITQKS